MNLKMIEEAKAFLGNEYFKGLDINFEKVNDPSYLEIYRNKSIVLIKYGELASLFRGLTYIKENASKDEYDKVFHKHFRSNCWMIDVSRNAVMRKEELKKI